MDARGVRLAHGLVDGRLDLVPRDGVRLRQGDRDQDAGVQAQSVVERGSSRAASSAESTRTGTW